MRSFGQFVLILAVAASSPIGRVRAETPATVAGEAQAKSSAPLPKDGVAPLATIEGQVITVDDFRHEMARRGMSGSRATSKHREALLEEMIRIEVLAASGRSAGYAEDPEIVLAVKRLLAEKYQREKLTPSPDALAVSDDEVGRYYEEHRAEYGAVEQRRAAVIFFRVPATATEDGRRRIRLRAEQVAAEAARQPAGGRSLGPLAAKHSEDAATRYLGGDTGWLRKGQDYRWGAAVTEAVFRLSQPGEIAPLVEGRDGLYVVRLVEVDSGQAHPLAAVKATIARLLSQERSQRLQREAYEKLRAGLAIHVDRALLGSIPVPPGEEGDSAPPPLPQGP